MAEAAQKFIKALNGSPEQLYDPTTSISSRMKSELKDLYNFCKKEEIHTSPTISLSQLVIENVDNEQIWQQIELQNAMILQNSIIKVSNLLLRKQFAFENLKKPGVESADESLSEDEVLSEKSDVELNEKYDTNQEESNNRIMGNGVSPDSKNDEQTSGIRNMQRKSVVDDQFFKLHEMEEFINREEGNQNLDSGNEQETDEESRESIDLFQDSDGSDQDNARLAKYKEFFTSTEEQKLKRNKYLEEYDSDGELDIEPSTLELRQSRLKEKINDIEMNALSEKPWQLQGEIKAENRPQNSLLEVVVDYDRTTRSAPIITGQTTLQLEDIIKQRIKDKAFDSVERKKRLVETPFEYKKKLTLDQEKSKASLAQIYEKEYLKEKTALEQENGEVEDKEPDSHKEIKNMLDQLFHQLDGLTNFYYTPTLAVPELKIISNIPAIHMEEVAPVAISDVALLAPEEVKNKPRTDTLGKTERTTTDKKRERRKKKMKQKHHAKLKEEQENSLKEKLSGEKTSKKDGRKMNLKKVTKMANVEQLVKNSEGKGHKSSTSFFMQLQDQVQSQIKAESKVKRQKKEKLYDAKKLKL